MKKSHVGIVGFLLLIALGASLVRKPVWSDDVADGVREVNDWLATLEIDRVRLFDTYGLLAQADGGIRSELARDTLHLNEQGYTVLNNALVELLKNEMR